MLYQEYCTWLKIHPKYWYKLSIYQHGAFLHIQGNLCFSNGQEITIQQKYWEILYELLNQKYDGYIKFSIMWQKCSIKFIHKIYQHSLKLNDIDMILDSLFAQLTFNFNLVLKILILCDIHHDFSPFQLKIAQVKSQLLKNMAKVFEKRIKTENLKQIPQKMVAMPCSKKYYDDIQIERIQTTDMQIEQICQHKGGYFEVFFKQCKLRNQNNQVIEKKIAIKQLKSKKKQNSAYKQKIQRQYNIVKHIRNTQYLVQYYHNKSNNCISYMQCVEQTLSQLLNAENFLTIHQLLDLCLQVIKAVKNLHESFVVHRDIKPSNILIKYENNHLAVKIIDFSESVMIKEDKFQQIITSVYGFTLPHSPLQCSSKDNLLGLNRLQIDFWSVGMLIYEIFFNKLPLSYSRPFSQDIKQSWPQELQKPLNQKRKMGLAAINDTILACSWKMMTIDQSQRMDLNQAQQLLTLTQQYLNIITKFQH